MAERERERETKQPLYKKHGSAVHLHLKVKGHSFQDSNLKVLSREERWFKRGVKELIFVRLEPFVHLQLCVHFHTFDAV